MLRLIKTLLKDNIFLIAITITLLIAYLSLMRMPKFDLDFNPRNIDKVYHSLAYFALCIAWLFSFVKKHQYKYLIVFLCIIYGIVIEFLQSILTSYRTGDIIDVLANSFGILLALIVFNQILKKLKLNKD